MKQSRLKIARSIADHTLTSGVSDDYTLEVAAYLLSERRVNDLDSVLRDIQSEWAAAGYIEVLASSAYTISNEIKAEITALIKKLYPDAKKIIVTEVHDPEIIGGVRLNLADTQLDLSVEAKLNRFKQLTNVG